jgi:asparagine synthase (glutamine-hydrolysing)
VACHEFLSTGIIYEDRTAYKEVRKLPPASVITYRDGQEISRQIYWDLSRLLPNSLSGKTATEALWYNDLTGGYDSRAMVAALVGAGASFTTVVSGPMDSPDVLISKGLAQKLGLEHIHNLRDDSTSLQDLTDSLRLSDGEYDVVEYSSTAKIHSKLSQSFDISINGSFGEVARGYWWELLIPHTGQRRKLDSRKLARLRYAIGSSNDLFQDPFRIDLVDHMTAVVERNIGDLVECPNTFQMDAAYLRMRMQRWQGRIASSTNRIWPCISPFMFRSVLEVMLQAEYSVRQRSLLIRQMLSKFQPTIAAFPLEHGYPALPATPATFLRFWPIVPGYARKAFRKVMPRRKTGGATTTRTSDFQASFARWIAEQVSVSSQCSRLIDPEALDAFVLASLRPDFSRYAEWNRLFSLTSALNS